MRCPAFGFDDYIITIDTGVVELPPRLYSMLAALVVIGLMLLVLTFLRH